MKKEKIIVMALGGSIVYPHDFEGGGLNIPFLNAFREFVASEVKKGKRFIIIVGGGRAARLYQRAVREAADCGVGCQDCSKKCLDLIGIAATKMNAELLKTVIGGIAYPEIMSKEPKESEAAAFLRSKKKVLIGSGWEPGCSTDYDAIKSAIIFGADEVISASDTTHVYDKDPKEFPDAKPIDKITWTEFQKLIPPKWTPGLKSPFDPEATRLAKKAGITVKRVKGTNLENLQKLIDGEEFEGSEIHKG